MAAVSIGAAALSLSLGGIAFAAPSKIGVAAAVQNEVQGILDGKNASLTAGADVYQNQVIQTGEKAMAQLLFLDQTSLSIGPNAHIKLDSFIFDPNRSEGEVVLEASRGAFRFITGAQDPNNYSIKTPVATIGVRGTIIDFLLIDGSLVLILDEGRAFITMADGTVIELDSPGDYIIVKADGSVIGPNSWEGSIDTVIAAASFPLYGFHFAEIPWDPDSDSTDDFNNLTDELSTHFITQIFYEEGEGEGEGSPAPIIIYSTGFGGSGGHPNNGCGNGGGDGVPGGSNKGDSC